MLLKSINDFKIFFRYLWNCVQSKKPRFSWNCCIKTSEAGWWRWGKKNEFFFSSLYICISTSVHFESVGLRKMSVACLAIIIGAENTMTAFLAEEKDHSSRSVLDMVLNCIQWVRPAVTHSHGSRYLSGLLAGPSDIVSDGVLKPMADLRPKGPQLRLGHPRVGELHPLSPMYGTRPCCLV